jgi:hypothetical protein
MADKTYTERIKVAGDQVLSVVRTVLHEGNVRRLIIRNEKDQVLIELPITVGVVGVLLAPVAAALGAVAALVAHCTIEIERVGEPPAAGPADAAEAEGAAAEAGGEAAGGRATTDTGSPEGGQSD